MTDPNTVPMITPVEKTAYNKHFLKITSIEKYSVYAQNQKIERKEQTMF